MDHDVKNALTTIQSLYDYRERYPQGVVNIGLHYYNIAGVINALEDIRLRSAVGGDTKADQLLMEILSSVCVPV